MLAQDCCHGGHRQFVLRLGAGQGRKLRRWRQRQGLPIGQCGQQGVDRLFGLAGHEDVGRWQPLVVHAPAVVQLMVHRDRDYLRGNRLIGPGLLERAGQIQPVQREHDVGAAQGLRHRRREEKACRAGVQRMTGGEGSAHLEVGQHPSAELFGQGHPRLPAFLRTRHTARKNEGLLRRDQRVHSALHVFGSRQGWAWRPVALHIGGGHGRRQLHLLQARVQANIDRPLGRGIGSAPGPQQGLLRGGRRDRLRVPLDEVPHQSSLVLRGMQPVYPGPTLGGIDWPGRAEHQHRNPVGPGIKDRHAAVHQSDIAVQHRRQHLPGDLGVAMSNRHRMLFMQHDEHLRLLIAQVVDQAVMQAAKTGTGVEQHIGDGQLAQQVGDDIAAPNRAAGLGGLGHVTAWAGGFGCAQGLTPI